MKIRILKRLVLVIAISFPSLLSAQIGSVKANWQNLDLKTDSVFGISTEKAYTELLKNKKHVTVIVAVIDEGVDIDHEDLKSVIWTNPKEIAGNHIDDDKNGYIDDTHGWNFIGGANGDVQYENWEYVRLIRVEKPLYEHADSTKLNATQLSGYRQYFKMKAKLDAEMKDAQESIDDYAQDTKFVDTLLADMGKPNPTPDDFKNYKPKNASQKNVVSFILANYKGNDFAAFRQTEKENDLKFYQGLLDYQLNVNYDPRKIVGDNPNDDNEHFYGNKDVAGPDPHHGTHVAGIIGADRENNIGIKGVANDVLIMPVRTIPDGDERDKDLANAIRYAADNGAKIINMSFGKDYSSDKKVIDDAVKYAVSKDVLIVHAAGNENADRDKGDYYPNKIYADNSGMAQAWIEVGASGPADNDKLKANFSSYGKINVDVFAPGVSIYSTITGSKYGFDSGTSMACPVVAGLAALIRSYYPKLTAVQVKEIILNSVVKVDHDITLHGKKVPFADICNTGGIVNAYNALKLAATY